MSISKNPSTNFALAIVTTALTIAYYGWLISEWNMDGHKDSSTTNSQQGYVQPPKYTQPRPRGLALPQNAFFIQQSRYACNSFLTVKTAHGAAYVIKVVNPNTEEVILMVYLPGGSSHEIDIPSGTFEIRYTCGTEWFGNKELFGPTASYAKTQRAFHFSRDAGYELTLYKVPHGNLQTKSLRKEDF